MVHYTLKQCRYFLAIAEHGGIAQAARVLNVSQPSVAQGLAKLEQLTRLTLFERHHARGTVLTVQGRLFLPHAEALIEQAQQVAREAQSLASEESGEIRLGCFLTIAAACLPGLMKSHQTAFPRIQIKARELTLAELATGLRQSSLDVALTYDIAPHLEGFEICRLGSIEPVVLLAADHPRARHPSVSLRDLGHEPYVAFDAPGSREYFQGLLDEAGVSPPIGYTSASLEGVRNAVGCGLGFTIAQLRPAQMQTYDGKPIIAVAIKESIKSVDLVVATRDDQRQNSVKDRFIEHARFYFRDQDLSGFQTMQNELSQ